jgi:hypothetical protein
MYSKLTGTFSQTATIVVPLRDVQDAYLEALRRHYSIPGDAYLDDKGRMVCDERGWRHGSVGTDILDANPSEEVVKALQFIALMKTYTMVIDK